MRQEIQWTGRNSQEICRALNPNVNLKEFELGHGVWIKQVKAGHMQLAITGRAGEVYLEEGDWAVQENDGGWVRLSPEQRQQEMESGSGAYSEEPNYD